MLENWFTKLRSGLTKTRKQVLGKLTEVISGHTQIDDDMLEEYLGDKVNERLRKRRIARQKKTPKTNLEQVKTTASKPVETKKEKVESRDFFKNMRKNFK